MPIGIAIPEINQSAFTVLAVNDLLERRPRLTGRTVKVVFNQEDAKSVVLGKVIGFEIVNDISRHLALARNLRNFMGHPQVERVVSNKNGLLLKCAISSAFDFVNGRWERSLSDAPVPPFSLVEWATEEDIREIVGDRPFFYIGRGVGDAVPIPLHLGDFSELNEAYHFVVAGPTGSGKSTLVKMLLVGYARNPSMNFFILDTAGEFARAFQDQDRSQFPILMASVWKNLKRTPPRVVGLDQMSLDTWELLEELLRKHAVMEYLGIRNANNQRLAVEYLTDALRKKKVKLARLVESREEIFAVLKTEKFAKAVYSDPDRQNALFQNLLEEDSLARFWDAFSHIAERFREGRPTPSGLVLDLMKKQGATIVLDLSTLEWEDPFKYLFIRNVVKSLNHFSMKAYREHGTATFNTLVVIEEAHRLVPPSSWIEQDEQAEARKTVLRALTETRKAGLGWMLISTRISNLDRAVYEESRVRIIGRGLVSGEDAERIRESYGPDVLSYYRSLPDPVDPMRSKRSHTFLVSGPVCVLSRDNPEFIETFDNVSEFFKTNRHRTGN